MGGLGSSQQQNGGGPRAMPEVGSPKYGRGRGAHERLASEEAFTGLSGAGERPRARPRDEALAGGPALATGTQTARGATAPAAPLEAVACSAGRWLHLVSAPQLVPRRYWSLRPRTYKRALSPGRVAPWVAATSRVPQGCGLGPPPGRRPGWHVRPSAGRVQEAPDPRLSHRCLSQSGNKRSLP